MEYLLSEGFIDFDRYRPIWTLFYFFILGTCIMIFLFLHSNKTPQLSQENYIIVSVEKPLKLHLNSDKSPV